MLASLPLVIVVAVVFGRRTRKIAREAQDRLADTATIVEETLQGIVNVKAFSNEGYELNRYHDGLGKFLTATLRGARLRAAFIAFIIFALVRFHRAGALVGGATVAAGRDHFWRPHPLRSLYDLCRGSDGPVRGVIQPASKGDWSHSAGSGACSGKPVRWRRAWVPRRRPLCRGCEAMWCSRMFHFTYPSRQGVEVLHAINLAATSGQRIALVGPSGAGKSTLISLLLRFMTPSAGRLMDRWPGRTRIPVDGAARSNVHGAAGGVVVRREYRGKHCLRKAGRERGRD